jgi:hypothetical protein
LKAERSFETSESNDPTTRRNNPEDLFPQYENRFGNKNLSEMYCFQWVKRQQGATLTCLSMEFSHFLFCYPRDKKVSCSIVALLKFKCTPGNAHHTALSVSLSHTHTHTHNPNTPPHTNTHPNTYIHTTPHTPKHTHTPFRRRDQHRILRCRSLLAYELYRLYITRSTNFREEAVQVSSLFLKHILTSAVSVVQRR